MQSWRNVVLCTALVLCLVQYTCAMEKTMVNVTGNATMDPAIMQVLDQVLHTLESLRNARIKDLNDVSRNLDQVASSDRAEDVKTFPGAEHGKKKPLITKTYGYKVTVYATPLNGTKKQSGAPGDLYPEASSTSDLKSSGSFPLPKYHGHNVGGHGGGSARHRTYHGDAHQGHNRGHHYDKGHLHAQDGERYHHSSGGHKKDAVDAGREKAEYAHERGAQNERGLKERTEIEYFEREQFKKDELQQNTLAGGGESAKKGQEHHGSHGGHHAGHGNAYHPGVVPGTYHYDQSGVQGPHLAIEYGQQKGGGGGSHGGRSYADKSAGGGHEEHLNHRQGQGLKERGFKITVEREVYLKDAKKEAGYGRHDREHHQALGEGGHHQHADGDKNKHLVKEHAAGGGHDEAYNHRQHHGADGQDYHHEALHDGGYKKGGPHIIYHGDNYYAPSDSGNNTSRSVVVQAPPRHRSKPRTSSRSLPLPPRDESVLPRDVPQPHRSRPEPPPVFTDDSLAHKESLPYQATPVKLNSRPPFRQQQPAVTAYDAPVEDVVRSYSTASRPKTNIQVDSVLESLTPPSTGKDRFAFDLPKPGSEDRVVFPKDSAEDDNLANAGSAEVGKAEEPWNGRSYSNAEYRQPFSQPLQSQARGPGVWYAARPS